MRKKYIESTSYYKLLEELTSLPLGSPTTPYYYKKRYDYIDVYVSFVHDEIEEEIGTAASKKRVILAFFAWKPKDVRRSSLVRQICQLKCDYSDFICCIFEPQVLRLSDFLSILAFKYTELATALEDVCKFDTQF